MLEDILNDRKAKLSKLKESGINPYPASVSRTKKLAEAVKEFAKLLRDKTKISVTGRIVGLRDQGNVVFLDLQDGDGRLQALLTRDNIRDFKEIKKLLDIGDFVELKGPLFLTKKNEKTLESKTCRIITKSIRPLPSEWYGLKDVEERERKRYLDFILNQEAKARLQKRSEIVREIREFMAKEGFTEVETPILQPLPGGALSRPFETYHNALDQKLYLRIAPELYLKRLLVGGFEKIFEIGKVFRNEGMDRDHNPEFTMMELYAAYWDWKQLMKFAEKLLKRFLPGKWDSITYADAFKKYAGRKLEGIPEEKIDEVFKKEVRPKIKKPTFITHYPKVISPLSKSDEKDPKLTERFQLIAEGTELVNGFSELNDPLDQRERMEEQEKRFRAGDPEASRLDEDFLEALEYGMPPTAGWGIGIDRLVSLVLKTQSIKEVIAFPTLRSKE